MKKEVWNWDFKALNPVDYEAKISFEAKNQLLKKVFNRSKLMLRFKGAKTIKGNPETINEFEIDARFHNLLSNITRKQLSHIQAEVGKDNIKMVSGRVYRAYFKRNKKRDWDIHLFYKGEYADER